VLEINIGGHLRNILVHEATHPLQPTLVESSKSGLGGAHVKFRHKNHHLIHEENLHISENKIHIIEEIHPQGAGINTLSNVALSNYDPIILSSCFLHNLEAFNTVATIEDGEFVDDPETGYFWSCFGMLIILIMQKSCNQFLPKTINAPFI